MAVIHKAIHSFNMCGVLIIRTEIVDRQRFVEAAEALTKNVALLGRDCSGMRFPFVIVPGRPTAVRVDVRTTSDGKFYLLHDSTLDGKTDGHGSIAKISCEAREKRKEINRWKNLAKAIVGSLKKRVFLLESCNLS